MLKRKNFFDALKEKCSTDSDYAAEVLKARGFLLEDTELALSDNSHRYDASYLNLLLRTEKLGEVTNGKIFIRPNANIEKIFSSKYISGSESFVAFAGWEKFLHDNFAPKVEVSLLEPFIARYVKAISACGVGTCGSCDGNHRETYRQTIFIDFMDPPNKLWHEIICKRLLTERFNLNWDYEDDTAQIELNKANKWATYIELNRAAEFLYDNRLKLRQIRREASNAINLKMLKSLPADELANIFSERANELLDELFKNI